MTTLGAIGGSAIGGILGGSTQSSSSSFDYGMGSNSGKSWNNSNANSWEYGSGNSYNDSYAENFGYGESDSWGWSQTNGTQASARDIERAKEANEQQYQFWKEQAEYNATEAQKARNFQEYMSNTAYQRAVKDLIAAGINPVLAAGMGGASTPAGAYANSGMAVAQKANTYADSVSRQASSSKSQQGGYSRSHGESSYENTGGSQSSSTGGSIQNGVNFNIGSSTSKSSGQSLLHDIGNGIGNAIGKIFGK